MALGCGAVVSVGPREPWAAADAAATASPPVTQAPAAPVVVAEPDITFTIAATGDVLTNMPVNVSARAGAGGYEFSPLLAGMDRWVTGADLALCHLEVPIAPAGVPPSGYPIYGAPVELVRDLAEQGWDGCSTASNHSVDRSFDGVVATLDALDDAGLGHVGTARTQAESAEPQIYRLEREGRVVTVAHLAGTYGTNGLPVPAEAPWSVTPLDVAGLVAQARAARGAGADLVVVSIHAGTEYTSLPNELQLDVASDLAASGVVDLVLGHHAHVPQPVVHLPGGPDGRGTWVAYGLGNYVSNQDGDCCDSRTDSGLFLTATVTQPADGPAHVATVEWTPVTLDRLAGHRVRAIRDALREPDAGTLVPDELRLRLERVRDAVGPGSTERAEPPAPTGPPPQVVVRAANRAD
ncbi:CapA family protein [Cellulosimicrobium terreum]|nr:CapA family protein [Cellulosimicrobium terreum]